MQAAHHGEEPPGMPREQAAQLHGRGEVDEVVVVAGDAAQVQVAAAVDQRPALIIRGPGSTSTCAAVSADDVREAVQAAGIAAPACRRRRPAPRAYTHKLGRQ